MYKAIFTATLMSVFAIGCGHDRNNEPKTKVQISPHSGGSMDQSSGGADDLPNLSKPSGESTFASTCSDPIQVTVQASETEWDPEAAPESERGAYQLIALKVANQAIGVSESGYLNGSFTHKFGAAPKQGFYDDVARVDCHNSFDSGTASASRNADFEMPQLMNFRSQEILYKAKLILQARKGQTAARVEIKEVHEKMLRFSSALPAGWAAVLVRNTLGQLILRISAVNSLSDGSTWKLTIEGLYEPL